MKIDNISVEETLTQAHQLLKEDKTLSAGVKAVLSTLILLIQLLLSKLNLNSKNSHLPPSQDPFRNKKMKKNKTGKKPGGQVGHIGWQLKLVDEPDEIKLLRCDTKNLPKEKYHEVGYERRQVIDIRISRHVTEYRAQILEDAQGNQWVATFPEYVTRSTQYGELVRAHAVYQMQFQLLPYNRVQDCFKNEYQMALSAGTLYNFNKEAYQLLSFFEEFVKKKLIESSLLHGDETGINIKGKNAWLHLAANEKFTYFFPHEKRGEEAMQAMGVLPFFKGVLCHDHWKPYFIYQCQHALCNAHHLRELTKAHEDENQAWALEMKNLLIEMNKATQATGNVSEKMLQTYYEKYRSILKLGEQECPKVTAKEGIKKRGRVKQTKARNLLERLSDFEEETLRFLKEVDVPFSNNLAENNIRMTKVQQKISGCFRSMEGAMIFCRIRSYISTCRKHHISVTDALVLLFSGKIPDFMLDSPSRF